MDLSQISKEEWVRRATEAVSNLDSAAANKSLRDWETFVGSKATEKQSDRTLESLRENLLCAAFAVLPTDLAAHVLKEKLSVFLRSGDRLLDPVETIQLRIMAAGYGLYDEEREMMKKALLANEEVIGKFSIGAWLKRFEKFARPEEENAVDAFFRGDPGVADLEKDDQSLLKVLVTIYEQWIMSPVISLFDVAVASGGGQGAPKGASAEKEKGAMSGGVITAPLLEALARHPQLAQQTITGGRVILRGASEGVRGSLSNWVKCYREELGVGYHDALKRGEFLFQSKNGKPLPPEERERVSLILRSIEDGEPVEVDTQRQEIIFPKRERSASPAPQAAPAGGMNFSSKHTFPAEKEVPLSPKPAQPRPPLPKIAPAAAPMPQPPRPAEPKFNPFRIDPVSKKNTDDKSQYGE